MTDSVDTEERLKEIVELTRLYDVYGALLSDHSKNIFESYVLDNYSLAEIAESEGLTRQGVRDIVVRYSRKLYEYEEKLGFLKKLDDASAELVTASEELKRLKDVNRKGIGTLEMNDSLDGLGDSIDRLKSIIES